MENITKEEFLQGVVFTHKNYAQKYKYGQTDEYGTYLVKQGGLMETSTIHTITESSFVVTELIFDVAIDVIVLFADCFAVENQPLTAKQPTIEAITKEEFYCPEMDITKPLTELCNLNKLAFYDSFLEREVIFYHCECNRTFDADLCETSQYNNLL